MIFGKNINKFYLRYWYLLLVGILALFVVDIFQLEIPAIIGSIVNGLNKYTNEEINCEPLTIDRLKMYMAMIAVIAGIMFVGRFLWRITVFTLGVKVESDLRDEMFIHSEKLSKEYYDHHKVGEEMALYTNDLQAIRQTFGSGLIMVVDALILGGYAFYKMIKLNYLLAIISAVPMIIVAVGEALIGKVLRKKYEKRQEAYAQLSDFTQENFSGITVVKAFVKEYKELLRFNKISDKNKKYNLEYVRISMLLWILIGLFIDSVLVIIIIFSGYLRSHQVSNLYAGEIVQFVSYFNALIWPMMAIGQLINVRSQGNASLKRINTMLNYQEDIKVTNPVDVTILGNIEYRNLSFKYPNSDKDVLENISLKIDKGMSVGIIGRTGCGKTTLVDMLIHIYNINRDQVFIDGVDVMDIDIEYLRKSVAYVPQDNFLFSTTILNNICFGVEENDLEKAKEYAKYAAVSENIDEFPLGYETILGERGVTLSGGQRQRVSIARALIKDAPILVLDDSVSAVDTETERKILSSLKSLRKDKTTLLVAHRISTVKDLDTIVLLDEGKIVAAGTHLELLENCKMYQDMVLLQQLDEEEGGIYE